MLFGSLGIPVAEHAIARAPGYAHAVPYPVAAKALSAGVLHKTEAGAVCLGIADQPGFDREVRAMLGRIPASGVVLVQKMQAGLAEAIVGYREDPVVGPVVLVGAGGTLAEIYRDFALRLAPVSEAEAAVMIGEVKGLATVRGYRGLPRGDVGALAKAVAALSRLALVAGRPVAEAEINPLIVKSEGVVAVDGRPWISALRPSRSSSANRCGASPRSTSPQVRERALTRPTIPGTSRNSWRPRGCSA